MFLFLLVRGAVRRHPERRSRKWRPAAVARNHGLGRLGSRSPGTTTRAARSSLHVLRRKCRSRKRGTEAENRHGVERREARRPDRKGRRGASQAPRPASQAGHRCLASTGLEQTGGDGSRQEPPETRKIPLLVGVLSLTVMT